MKTSTYSHAIPGRLRIKIPQVKGSEVNAQKVERVLRSRDSVNSVKANPLTGNVLVLFDADSLTHTDVIDILIQQGYLKRQRKDSSRSRRTSLERVLHPEYIGKAVADIALQTAVEFAVKRALLALA
jgi:Heavy metal associated domain 2